MEDSLTVLDLFSGCGGFSYGFQSSGFRVVAGVDNSEIALKTFELNHIGSKGLLVDMFADDAISKIKKSLPSGKVDVIIGGPPCQGFSLTGTRRESDKRNRLFYSVFELAKETSPSAIIIENVPGIVKLYGGVAKAEIYRLAEEMGYSCTHKELFAPDYGVPQIRKRVFFVALKKELGIFEFPEPTNTPEEYVGCEAAIGDLPSLESDNGNESMDYSIPHQSDYQMQMREGSNRLFNHVSTIHSQHVVNVISQVPEGGNHKDLPPGVGDSRQFNEAWTRYHSQKPSKTIDTGHRNHFHYKWNRVPTVRENARLQSFPDKFVFKGNKTEQYRQVGNAVPPILGKVIADALKDYLIND